MDISTFIELRLREAKSPVHEVQQMVSALEMIAGAHRDSSGYPGYCAFEEAQWPCLTIRFVAWTWRDHPDYHFEWHWDHDFDEVPLSSAERAYLVNHAGADPEVFDDPARKPEDHSSLPTRLPIALPAVIEALPAGMSHSEVVALLNAPHGDLDDMSPIVWMTDGGAGIRVIDALVTPLGPVADALGRAMPLEYTSDWLVKPNAHLGGGRPLDVLRDSGPARVLRALTVRDHGTVR